MSPAAALSPALTIRRDGMVSYDRPPTVTVRQSLSPQAPQHGLAPVRAPSQFSRGLPATQILLEAAGSRSKSFQVSPLRTERTAMPRGPSARRRRPTAFSTSTWVPPQRGQVSPFSSSRRCQRIVKVGMVGYNALPSSEAQQKGRDTPV